jgi:hypothetical protein
MENDTENQCGQVSTPPVIAGLSGSAVILAAIGLFSFGNVCLYQGFYDGLTIIYLVPTYGPGFLLLLCASAARSFGRKLRLMSLGALLLCVLSVIGTGLYAEKYREPPVGWGQASNSPQQ